MGRAPFLIPLAVLGVAVGVYTVGVVHGDPVASFAGDSNAGAIALLAAGWPLIASGLAFWWLIPGNRVGPLLVAAGLAWFFLEWINPQVESALAFTIGLCLYAAAPPLVGHAVLAFPGGRVASVAERSVLAVAYVGAVLVLGLVPALLTSPSATACSECPQNLLAVTERPGLADRIQRFGLYLGVGWSLALALLVLGRLVLPTAGARRRLLPLAGIGAAYLALVAATFAASLDRGFLWNGPAERRLWLAQAVALVGIAAAIAWNLLLRRRARATVARLVVELARSPPPGGLRDVLAGILGDPNLTVAYPLREAGRLVDADGRPADVSREVETSLVSDGQVVAVLAHAPGLLEDEQLVDEVAAAARLVLENERLHAEVRARLEELRASRARIVAAGDAERRRLERDLHDGAQQRLVALALALRLLRSQLDAHGDERALRRLDEADVELGRAISELRELAEGIFPTVLADAGLAAAVRALAEGAHVPMRIGSMPTRRYPSKIEMAAYAVVAEAVRNARHVVAVQAEASDSALVVEVASQESALLDVTSVADRIGALDGRLDVARSQNGDVTITAEFPCAS
jgi:signal transduction histidine kinase